MKTNHVLVPDGLKEPNSLSTTTSASKIIDDHFICALFNLNVDQVLHVNCVSDTKIGSTDIHITLIPTYPICPACGAPSPSIKDYYVRSINHSILSNTHTRLLYRDRRYQCKHCHKTFFDKNPFVEEGFKHSLRTTQLVLEDLRDPNMTMSAVARRYHLSPTTIAHIFDAHVDIGRKPLPKFLSIDEVYAFKSNTSKYICVLLDYSQKIPVDILPSRTYEDLARFFSAIPLKERENVICFSCDMWKTYRSIAKNYLPNAKISVDHFHISQECTKRLNRVRIETQKTFPKKSDAYYLLKKFNWVLFNNDDSILDPNRKKKYNRRLKKFLNYHDIKCLLQESHPQLEMAVNLKDALSLFYDSFKLLEENIDPLDLETVPSLKFNTKGDPTYRSRKLNQEAKKRNSKKVLTEEEAMKELDELIKRFRDCPVIELSSFASTLYEWRFEIINSLRVYDALGRKALNNGLIENQNKIIKNVKRTSNAYANWPRFRNRLLYSLNKESTYSLNVNELVIRQKRKMNRENYMRWKMRQNGNAPL